MAELVAIFVVGLVFGMLLGSAYCAGGDAGASDVHSDGGDLEARARRVQ